ncbi:TonB-dependent receptor [Plesiocystis pacifica SIR-1]|uniref:TonB-dependent receptor n=1 Tax=Plesiocystis pacifica SIR-1 TaxID=391625 RepID=A6GDW2_9BACT|nr:TonB-dependent receptor [Plesiocystis pacifica]EDM75911.1 TonB-dependent receptor [Plesiocystis pacifica SIR-1]
MVHALPSALLHLSLLCASPPPASPPAAVEGGEDDAAETAARPYRTEVVSDDAGDGLDAQRALSKANLGFVTAIDLRAEGPLPSDDLATVVSRAPGVTVRSIGGLGQFSAISIRGSTSLQVPVFLDGAPLTGSLSGLVDLSTAPLDALARVEVYRGHVPVRYGAAAIGGAVDLVGEVHRGPPRLWAAAGFGSFLARELRVGYAQALPGGWSVATRVGYAGARGDFPYFDDGNTPQLEADDGQARRANNHYDRGLGQLRFDHRRGPTTAAIQGLAWWKLQGIPGTAQAPASETNLRMASGRLIAKLRHAEGLGPGGYFEWVGSVAVEDRVLRDLDGEVGLSANDQRALGVDGWLSPRMRVALWRSAWLNLSAELRHERIDVDERYGADAQPGEGPVLSSGDAARSRTGLGLGLELDQWLLRRRWAVSPGLRLDAADSRFAVPEGEGEVDDEGRDERIFGVSPRLATKVKLLEGVELRASVGRYLRQPTLSELFGDRGYVVGNEGLRPEQGTKVDGGLLLDLRRPADTDAATGKRVAVFAQVVGFATWSVDRIAWIRSGPVVRAINLASTRVRGLETGLSVRARVGPGPAATRLELDAAYTFLDSRNDTPEAEQNGKPLPGRPRHSLLLRPGLAHRFAPKRRRPSLEPRVGYELEWIAGTTLDLSGRVELPPRLLHGLSASLRLADRVELGLSVRNLSDQRRVVIDPSEGPPTPYPAALSDFIGYPIPGRSVWGTLRVDFALRPSAPRGPA